ncbi:cation transporter [Solihabitans fulvus]|uniref:Cation transporter n=1 Tax=Solihabitans fulvus TaxID=1892852 RepID=A0A5B2XH59_9PSEU|nr:cation diffusion facilitator family transporter [Solihabitans fulvus]KAA2262399.1 cation transporter [Solihabitans fulvus]
MTTQQTPGSRYRGRLFAALGISLAVIAIELVGWRWTGSLALLADATHLSVDALGVALALFAIWLAGRPATARRTFGLQRAEVLAAAVNAIVVIGMGIVILVGAVQRFANPPEVATGGMLLIALIALAGNATSVLLLRSGQKESLNVKGAFLEVLSDALAAASTAVAAVVMALTGFQRADAIVSALIGIMLVPRAIALLRSAVNILLQAAPPGIDTERVRERMASAEGVSDVHDLHVYSVTSGVLVASAHVVTPAGGTDPRPALDGLLRDEFGIEHSTIQVEPGARCSADGTHR